MSIDQTEVIAIPTGSPEWVTPELLTETLATWQAHYNKPLTPAEALEILLNAARLFDTFKTMD